MAERVIKLYYLTGTGNSLKIAKDLGSKLGSHELISMPHLIKKSDTVIIKGDIVGFVFPVYFAKPPVFIEEFIARAEFGQIDYMFAVINGGGLFGRALKLFETLIKGKGKTMNAGFMIEMPGNHPKIAVIHRKMQEEYFRQESVSVDMIADIVGGQIPYTARNRFEFFESVFAWLSFDIPYYFSTIHMFDKFLWIDDNCVNCGTCVRVCPVNNIVRTDRRPRWQHRCINCLACYHHCPWKGIRLECPWKIFDFMPYGITERRYRHPEITLEEIIYE
ncbi:MAG: hypothetical protein E4H36_07435 [Spirochaetales bacterium]|nr:MAG: hypothetical protein E4H36_07435 [Spirochaetales bacterium]